MKKYFCFLFLNILFLDTYSQKINSSAYYDFRNCVINFLKGDRKKKEDSLIIIFNCNAVIFDKSYHSGGAVYTLKGDSCYNSDTEYSNLLQDKIFITSTNTFDFFLNFLFCEKEVNKKVFNNLKGNYAYVFVPVETWEQFYIDYLIGYDKLLVSPTIDLFKFDGDFMDHVRYQLTCNFTKGSKVTIRSISTIRKRKFSIAPK